MTWTVSIFDLDGTERIADLPWSGLSFVHVLNAPGGAQIDVSMANVSRANVEPGMSDYRIFQDGTLRAAGRIWNARVDPALRDGSYRVTLTGEGIAGVLAKRLIAWEARYEPLTEARISPNTAYGMSQEEILFDLVSQAQLEDGGDLGIGPGTHTGGSHLRRRWYCEEDGMYLADVFDDFAGLTDGLDWAVTPTLTDDALLTFATWNPQRGTDLSGTVILDEADFLDTFTYEIDAGQIVTRGRAVGEGECDPPMAEVVDATGLANYGLLESFEASNSDQQEDADETAESLLSPLPFVSNDVWYELSRGPALGEFDVGDTIGLTTNSRTGWEIDAPVRVEEVEVQVQLPDDDAHTFVRVNCSEVGGGS